jgi:hypothetical protein
LEGNRVTTEGIEDEVDVNLVKERKRDDSKEESERYALPGVYQQEFRRDDTEKRLERI